MRTKRTPVFFLVDLPAAFASWRPSGADLSSISQPCLVASRILKLSSQGQRSSNIQQPTANPAQAGSEARETHSRDSKDMVVTSDMRLGQAECRADQRRGPSSSV